MKKYITVITTIFTLFVFQACERSSHAENSAIAKVNGTEITQEDFSQFKDWVKTMQNETPPDDSILDEMIATELLRQEAEKNGIEKRKDVQYMLKKQHDTIVINTFMKEKFGKLTFTDEELKQRYDKQLSTQDNNEYKAKHILVKTQEEAEAIIKELDKGGDFAKLAKEKSSDSSAKEGGDLGWFKASTMVQPFAQAVAELTKGAYTKKPVNTRFGWHVIMLEDKRTATPPKFEDVKEQIRQGLVRQKVEGYVADLHKQAKIEKFNKK